MVVEATYTGTIFFIPPGNDISIDWAASITTFRVLKPLSASQNLQQQKVITIFQNDSFRVFRSRLPCVLGGGSSYVPALWHFFLFNNWNAFQNILEQRALPQTVKAKGRVLEKEKKEGAQQDRSLKTYRCRNVSFSISDSSYVQSEIDLSAFVQVSLNSSKSLGSRATIVNGMILSPSKMSSLPFL